MNPMVLHLIIVFHPLYALRLCRDMKYVLSSESPQCYEKEFKRG